MSVQIEQKSYEMPPRDGFTVTFYHGHRHQPIG